LLYNALRDVEEIAFNVAESWKPEWKSIKAEVVVTNNDEVRLRINEVPTYLNIVDALLTVRDLLKLVLEMDEEVRVMEIDKLWLQKEEDVAEIE